MTKFSAIIAILIFSFSIFCSSLLYAQEKKDKQYKVASVAFYNMENVYDTLNDPNKDDDEFTPEGKNHWNGERYKKKLIAMSEVIAQLGSDVTKSGPTIMGMSEIENRQVVQDLINQAALKNYNYDIVHYDSPDKRGVDVAFIYQKKRFVVTHSINVPLHFSDGDTWPTRDQLVVSGLLDGEPIHFIVNHWPSRRGGDKASTPKRKDASNLCMHISDSIRKLDPNAKIIIMGDLNDDPIDESLTKGLKSKGKMDQVGTGDFFNPMWKLYKDGIGSLAYKDAWNLFDQIIVSGPLCGDDRSTYKYFKARVFNENFLKQKDGQFSGYPFRTYVGEVWQDGYSDHFPVYMLLTKLVK